jgi:copper chaperone NosL
MRMKHAVLTVWLILVLVAGLAPAAEKAPAVPATAKCPVCGMFVARYPDWAGSIRFRDGATVYFDGPKDLFTCYLAVGKYAPGRDRSDIAALSVKDYYALTVIDARKAFYVIGSDVRGPMGKELVPFAKGDDARGFLNDHRGKRVLRFGEITPETLKALE